MPSQIDIQSDQTTSVDTLLGELGPDSSSEQLDDKLFMTSPTLCRGEAVGGMVDSVVFDEYNEPVQLQRITSRCFCQIYCVNYGTEAGNVDKDSVPPVTPVVCKLIVCCVLSQPVGGLLLTWFLKIIYLSNHLD